MVNGGPAGSRNAGTGSSPVTGGWERVYLAIFLQNAPQSQKIRKSCITFCRENRNGKIYNKVMDSSLFSFKNKRQILVRVGTEFQKDTMDTERKKMSII